VAATPSAETRIVEDSRRALGGAVVTLARCGALEERKGDLFSAPAAVALAHCVSRDLAMGKGIAIAFKSRFGHVRELVDQKRGVGEVAHIKHEGRIVFYLITKDRYWRKPTYATLTASLIELRRLCATLAVTEIAIPRIGCGLDGLPWPSVRAIIQRELVDAARLTVTVYTRT
jgi:O-acetyl-ADP-ribose deacetylase (regulator of RNase III)